MCADTYNEADNYRNPDINKSTWVDNVRAKIAEKCNISGTSLICHCVIPTYP